MKKQKIFNFALTTMCVAVLSACGSSGGGSLAVENTPTTPSANANANTGSDNSAALTAAQKAAQEAAAKQAAAEQEVAAAKAAAEKAAAEKAAAEQAAKDAAAKAKEDTAKAVEQALKDKEAADKKAAEDQAKAEEEAAKKAAQEAAEKAASDKTNPFGAKDQLTAEPDTARNQSFVGFKQTVKNNSNLATNQSTGTDSTSDVPTPMAVQNPHPSLDTIVVAEPKDDAGAARVYLEDFDTRFASTRLVTGVGNRQLTNIYRTESGATNGVAGNPSIEKQRKAMEDAVAKAKADVVKLKQAAVEIDKTAYSGTGITAPTKDEMEKVKDRIGTAGSLANTYGTGAGLPTDANSNALALSKIEMDALYAKKNELSLQLEQLKDKVKLEETKLAQLQFELNTFNHNNPEPTQEEKNKAAEIHVKREDKAGTDTGLGYATKTDTHGSSNIAAHKDGSGIWVMSYADVWNRHQNFTEKTTKVDDKDKNEVKKAFLYKGRDHKGNILVEGYNIEKEMHKDSLDVADVNAKDSIKNSNKESVKPRHLDDTVAELYGYRSRAWSTKGERFEYPQDVMDLRSEAPEPAPGEESDFAYAASNLPLVNEYRGAKLHNVQYGRVTTKLNNLAASEDYLKKGLDLDSNVPTYIASFGGYGEKGTENHYFYRGINNVGAKELEVLKADPKNGVITYNGHAVAYGLDNNYRGDIPIPTAVGAQAGFVSGNHAYLEVNLGNNQVAGSIYNKWYDSVNSPDRLRGVSLVDLQGVIADNGNIAGTATRVDNKATGVFGATLFGNGAEVGGSFASDKHSKEEQWGGVFAGIREPKKDPEAPAPSMATGTDKKN